METQIERKKQFKGHNIYEGLLALVKDQFPKDGSLLDVGAGDGFLMRKIKESFGTEVVGIDLEPEMNLLCKQASLICHSMTTFLYNLLLRRG